MRILLSALLLFVSSIVSAQTKLSGKVLSKEDSSAIHYAHVRLGETGVGTYTNTEGEFELIVEDSLSFMTIEISSIGFNSKKVSIQSLLRDSIQFLGPSFTVLDEVVIHDFEDSLGRIVQNALRKIKRNYIKKQHILECFYRETIQQDGKYVRLIEAAVSIQDNGIKSATDNNRIKIHEIRKSNDYYNQSILAKLFHFLFRKDNQLYELYNKNLVRKYYPNRNDRSSIYSKRIIDFFDFSLQEIFIGNEDSILVINYYPKRIITPLVEGKPDSVFAVLAPYGKLFINAQDLGIVQWIDNFGLVAGDGIPQFHRNRSYFNQKDSRSLHIKYQKFQGEYFLSLVKEIQFIDSYTFQESFLMVNQIITDKSLFKKIKRRNILKKDVSLYSSEFEYNPDFWENYTILLESPLNQTIKEDLNKTEKLEEQFKNNSKK